MKTVDLGRMSYRRAWEEQLRCLELVIAGGEDTLVFVEHDPVLTLGASFHTDNLLLTPEQYQERGIEVVKTDRGGDVTYHGPGQLVIYPVFNLKRHGQDLHKWLRDLEEAVIVGLRPFGIQGWRFPPHTGVWVGESHNHDQNSARKIAAIGVKIRKWVNLHGIAINVENDLDAFSLIVPCGIIGYGVTSVAAQCPKNRPQLADVRKTMEDAFMTVFESGA